MRKIRKEPSIYDEICYVCIALAIAEQIPIANAFLRKSSTKEADMGYIRAEEILPQEMIELIQQYVDGANIYIPRKQENRQEWGAKTAYRVELRDRNHMIYMDYLSGMTVYDLAETYYLSEKSIQRIIRQERLSHRELT